MNDLPLEESFKDLNKLVSDISGHLIPLAAKRAGISLHIFEKRLKKVGAIRLKEVNAFTCSSDNWRTFEVYLNVGLMLFFWKTIKLFASGLDSLEETHGKAEQKANFFTIATKAEQLMEAFWEEEFLALSTFEVSDMNDVQVAIAGRCIYFLEHFAIGHEFGHAIMNYSNQDSLVKGIAKGLFDGGFKKSVAQNILQTWALEIAADKLGLELLLMHAEDLPHSSLNKGLLRAAVELFFIMQIMLEVFYEIKTSMNPPVGSHPPSKLRLLIMRRFAESMNVFPDESYDFGNAWGNLANKILEHITCAKSGSLPR